jgi:hypothetical protein
MYNLRYTISDNFTYSERIIDTLIFLFLFNVVIGNAIYYKYVY